MNPIRILVQRVLCDALVDLSKLLAPGETIRDVLDEPARGNMGMIQTFEVRISLSVCDGSETKNSIDYRVACNTDNSAVVDTRSMLVRVARHVWGKSGADAATEYLSKF